MYEVTFDMQISHFPSGSSEHWVLSSQSPFLFFVDLSPLGDLPLGIYLPSLLLCFVWGGCQPRALGWLCDLGLASQS